MNKLWRRLLPTLIVVLCSGVLLGINTMTALAISDGNVSVAPAVTKEYGGLRSWFVYEAEPKTVIKDKIEVSNRDEKTNVINIAVLDGATTSSGGYTLVGGKNENKDIGTWATVSEERVTLLPNTKKLIDLTITVPDNADVGSHAGGVVIWRDSAGTNQGSTLKIVTRVAARIYLTVPGDIVRGLDISDVHHKIKKNVLYFAMTMVNRGNVTIEPEADVKLSGIFGEIGKQDKSQFGMMLRGDTIKTQIPWQKRAPKIGRFVADLRIHYGEKDFKGEYVKDEYQDVRYVFWLFPWREAIWLLAALLLLLLIWKFWFWIKVRQRLNTKTKQHTVKKGETLSTIAQFHGVNAKKIAKFNILRWPYDLQAGDILLIPYGKLTKAEQQSISPQDKAGSRFRLGGRNDGRKIGRDDNPSIPPLTKGRLGGVSRITSAGLEPVIAEAGDTVKHVAEFAGVTSKEIIRINQLKWPYRLRAGQELFIPSLAMPKDAQKTTQSRAKNQVKSSKSKPISRLSRQSAPQKTSRLSIKKKKPKK